MEATQNVAPLSPRRRYRRKPRMTVPARPRPLALGYIRVSTAEQAAEGASMEAQRGAITAKAAAKGWDLEIISEPALSAKDLDNRPGLTAALARLDGGEADYLVATALDRISRSVQDVADLMARTARNGWALASLREEIDTSTATGRLFVHMIAAISEFERSIIGERTKAGMAQKKLEGAVFGKPSKLDPAVRARITAQYAAGVSCTQIARELAAEGVPTAHGGQWRAGTVRYLVLAADANKAA